jgi:hypothetical protein
MTADERPIDVTAWIGGYPFRDVPHPTPDVLVRVLDREGFGGAWVGDLPGAFHRDPVASNRQLYAALRPYREVLFAAPMVRPDWPDWEGQLRLAVEEGAPVVRVYPSQWGLGAGHPALHELACACGAAGVVLHVTVRFEDLRQRHPLDGAPDVPAATLRALARTGRDGSRPVLLVAGAGRELIEETHWGLTVPEQAQVFYDFHWLWGPPEDHFGHLVRTMGAERFTWSSWWPLRLTQQSRALVELLPDDVANDAVRGRFADGRRLSALARARSKTAAVPREPIPEAGVDGAG